MKSSISSEPALVTEEQALLDITFMKRAIELAQQAELHDEIPVGAVVVYQDKIIGEGFNQSIMLNDPSSHAEMNAIRAAGDFLNNYRLLDCTLYVTLEPCPMCAGLLVHSRIKRLVYACSDLKTGAAGSAFNLVNSPQLNHQIEVQSGNLQEECSQLLSSFFKRRRKEKKQAKQAAKKTSL
ncbi:tRNA adenosine(34) deaminase TadA [Colwellia psychrerythraea]|uniref:tRNA-specific adenosine deaminase n=1 Tax=Colwellia psychrerythraea TaxID=28229 RepID=A0A099KZT5_COLPS|nr:tRNA adenosine(34) deaminase TadA [Colwellia psychrerythraea]KGJ96264.1 CMP/dCMP deaminase zinc-binding protein [Colwellia psychrerythraea]